MATYINSIASIVPQDFSQKLCVPQTDNFQAIEPNYQAFISSGEQRRMSRLVKMGVFSAFQCIQNADLQQLDGIAVGTGWGGFDSSKKFETAIIEKQESMLSPTTFIQALHNTIAGQIALNMKCYEYNITYSHRGFSFESALMDAMMLLNDKDEPQNILVGGVDELPEVHTEILRRAGYVKTNHEKVENPSQEAIIPGEGSTFTIVSSEKNDKTLAQILSVSLLYNPETSEEVNQEVMDLLAKNHLTPHDIDVLVLGNSGNSLWDSKINESKRTIFSENDSIYFKNLCGEYPTSTAFALEVATNYLKQSLPISMFDFPMNQGAKYALIINHFKDTNYSFILITKP
jgi:3-oxoacyl-[acyl-carrier-protein] synthase II